MLNLRGQSLFKLNLDRKSPFLIIVSNQIKYVGNRENKTLGVNRHSFQQWQVYLT